MSRSPVRRWSWRGKLGEYCVEDDKDQYNTVGIQLGERYEASPIVLADATPVPPDAFHSYIAHDRAGARLPHFALPDGTSLYAALGPDFSLIAFGDADTSGFEAAARVRKMPLTVVRVAGVRPEPTKPISFWCARTIILRGMALLRAPMLGALLDRICGVVDPVLRSFENAIAR